MVNRAQVEGNGILGNIFLQIKAKQLAKEGATPPPPPPGHPLMKGFVAMSSQAGSAPREWPTEVSEAPPPPPGPPPPGHPTTKDLVAMSSQAGSSSSDPAPPTALVAKPKMVTGEAPDDFETLDGGRPQGMLKINTCVLCKEQHMYPSYLANCFTVPGARREVVAGFFECKKSQSRDFHQALGQPFNFKVPETVLACYKCIGQDLHDDPDHFVAKKGKGFLTNNWSKKEFQSKFFPNEKKRKDEIDHALATWKQKAIRKSDGDVDEKDIGEFIAVAKERGDKLIAKAADWVNQIGADVFIQYGCNPCDIGEQSNNCQDMICFCINYAMREWLCESLKPQKIPQTKPKTS